MTEQAETPKPKKQRARPRTTAERVAAMQAGGFLGVRRDHDNQVKAPGAGAHQQTTALVAKLLNHSEAAAAELRAKPAPVSVPKAPLELALAHARSMVRKQKREPNHACLVAARVFGLDPEVVCQAWEASNLSRAPKQEAEDAQDGFDDDDWDEDA